MDEPEITDYNYILSSVGNAYFSNVSFDELWNCVMVSESREQLDAAISATIKFKELIKRK